VYFMSRRFGKIIGVAVVSLWLLALGAGIVLLGKAHTMAAHTDERKAQELTDRYEEGRIRMSPQERERREREIAALRTAKWRLYNLGIGICLAGATLAVGIVRFQLWDMYNLRAATTPRTRARLIALASVAWLALIPAFFLDLQDAYDQDDLMPHDDVGHGMFLLLGVPIIVLIWLAATILCRFVVLRKVNLPARLWYVDYSMTYRSVGLTVFYGAMICLLAASVMLSALYFKWGIPSGLVGTYVMLSSRAGLLNREVENSSP
jgi:hypothetical protein